MSNKNSTSLRRIRADLRELTMDKNSSDRYTAAPLEHDMFEWHFTIRGPINTDYNDGVYHGRILLPPDYPYKPPHIIFLTPNGRFDINTKICLSFSAFHPELWQPAWGIRLILEALIAFLPTPTDGAIGAIDYSSMERKKLAVQSQQYFCPTCQCHTHTLLRQPSKNSDTNTTGATTDESSNMCQPTTSSSLSTLRFQKEIEELQRLQLMEHAVKEETMTTTTTAAAAAAAAAATTTTVESNEKEASKLVHGGNGSSNEPTHDNKNVENSTTTTKMEESSSVTTTTTTSHNIVDITLEQQEEEIEQGTKDTTTATTTETFRNDNTVDRNQVQLGVALAEPKLTTSAATTTGTTATAATNGSNNNNTSATTTKTKTNTNKILPMMDHITNITMVVLAMICAILLRNIQLLLYELRDLSTSTSSS